MRLDRSWLAELRGCGNVDRVQNRVVAGVNKYVYKVGSSLEKGKAEAADAEAKPQRQKIANGKRWPQPDRPRCRVSSRVICWRLEVPYSYLAGKLATVALASCDGGSLEVRLTRRSSGYPFLQVWARGRVINHALARRRVIKAREQCWRSCLRFQLQRRRVECVDGE